MLHSTQRRARCRRRLAQHVSGDFFRMMLAFFVALAACNATSRPRGVSGGRSHPHGIRGSSWSAYEGPRNLGDNSISTTTGLFLLRLLG